MLRLEELHVRYGRVPAVNGISLEVGDGEAVSVVGPNGAGKTTTLGAIIGARRQVTGAVQLQDESLVGLTPESIVRKGISLVPEGRQIFTTLSVKENLQIGGVGRRDPAPPLADDLEHELSRFPVLRRYLDSPAGELSGGEQQQLAIARALLARPRLLMLDEPSLGLAPKMIDTVFASLSDLKQEGISILLVEQNAWKAIEFADRSYVLEGGRVQMTGTREELLKNPELEAAYLGAGAK